MGGKRRKYVPDMWLHRDALVQLAQERFAFLTQEKGFVVHSSEQGVMWPSFYYTHLSTGLGVQVQLDFRDTTVRVHLVRLRDGELPPNGYVDPDRSERIRVAFLQLLRSYLNVEDAEVEALYAFFYAPLSPERPRDHQWAEEALERWHDVVLRSIDLVLQQPIETLFPPPPPGASPASQA
jgi:hypothetical protein